LAQFSTTMSSFTGIYIVINCVSLRTFWTPLVL